MIFEKEIELTIKVKVSGDYEPAQPGSYNCAPVPEEFEVEKILLLDEKYNEVWKMTDNVGVFFINNYHDQIEEQLKQ